MSYTVKVTVSEGKVSTETFGDIPDGMLTVNGHEDAGQASLSVARSAPGGELLQSASATQYKGA